MRLLTRTSLYYVLFSLPILAVAGFLSYYFLNESMLEGTDELLLSRKENVIPYLKVNNEQFISFLNSGDEEKVWFQEGNCETKDVFSDTSIYNKEEEELIPYRILRTSVTNQNGCYTLKLMRSALESEEVFLGVFTALLILLALLFVTFLLLNLYINKKLWQPFYQTLNRLENFKLSQNVVEPDEEVSTHEFNLLNTSINKMMSKMTSDYQLQKQFTDNASHEMQTPLAVMQAKLELLMQSRKLGEEEMLLINTLNESISKLVRLNKSLLLLSKIENRQFESNSYVAVNDVLENSLQLFQEYIESRGIAVSFRNSGILNLKMHRGLVEILVGNLLQNAIRHNLQNGKVIIEISEKVLSISNTAGEFALNESTLFERFSVQSDHSDSNGLGLAIAREIATVQGLELSYRFKDGLHCFVLICSH
jgi:signal transduction histidine kinase